MRQIRWPLDGPEPPPTVRRISLGPGGAHWAPSPWPGGASHRPVFRFDLDQWRRRPCSTRYSRTRRSVRFPRRVWRFDTAFRCAPYHYHWTNGDRSRPWSLLASRAHRPYAIDLDALRRVRPRRAKWRKRK